MRPGIFVMDTSVMCRRVIAALTLSVAAVGCGPAEPPGFQQISQTILSPSCATSACHARPDRLAGAGLVLETDVAWANMVDKPVQSGAWPIKLARLMRVAPGDPDASALMLTLRPTAELSEDLHMPPIRPLPDDQVEAIRSWIERGAPND